MHPPEQIPNNAYPTQEAPPAYVQSPLTTRQPGAQQDDGIAKGSAIGIAVLIHALIFLLLTFIVLQTMSDDPPELIVESSDVEAPIVINPKQFATETKPNPSAPSMAKAMVVSTTAPSLMSVPAIEDTDEFEIGLGDAFGAGLGIGIGGSGGGGIGFFGSRSMAERVVFIVDVSASLSDKQFSMIKEELTKSLNRLAPTWFAEDEVVTKGRGAKKFTIKQGRQEYVWTTVGGAHQFSLQNRKDLPTAKWLRASKASLHKTKKHIEAVKKMYGTDWEWPLKVALQQMEPKPDVIYFLTDGVTGGVEATLNEIAKINRSKGRKSKINTISMMQPRAADALRQLAKDAGGKLTIVNEDGTTTEDKMRGGGKAGKGKGKKKPKK